MEQLQQEQQLNQAGCNQGDKQKLSIHIHNPNTHEQTAKYLAKLILQQLKEKGSEGSV